MTSAPPLIPGPHPGKRIVSRRTTRFLTEPPTVRTAAGVIVAVTGVIVVSSAVVMRVFDHREFGSIWLALWWAIQTVTTVGYGDVTPKNVIGRIVATFVMLEGIAFVAIVTAAITSSFVARAQYELGATVGLEDLAERLERIEALLHDHPLRTMPGAAEPD
jgi:voltage-gated potassium channel Kch